MPGNDIFTNILLHMDGVNAGTTFTDSNQHGSAHTWTANSATTDTGTVKFGTASANFGAGVGWIDTPDSADFTLGSGDWTVDCWVNRQGGDGTNRYFCGQSNSAGTAFPFVAGLGTGNVFGLLANNGAVNIVGTTAITTTGWHHFAGVRAGNVLKMFVDGVQEGGDQALSGALVDSTDTFAVGRAGAVAVQTWNGYVDEFRLSVGIARWTANFTPPDAPYDTQQVLNAPQPPVSPVRSGVALSFGFNPNLQTNPIPFKSTDRPRIVNVPLVGPPQSLPLNTNLFTNPIPFVSTNRPMVWRVPLVPPPQSLPLNLNLFKNAIPFAQADASKPWPVYDFTSPAAYPNLALQTAVVVTAPFYKTDWSNTWPVYDFTAPQAYPNLALSNPIPINSVFPPRVNAVGPLPPQAAPYNINVYTNPVPFAQKDWSRPQKLQINPGLSDRTNFLILAPPSPPGKRRPTLFMSNIGRMMN